MAKRTCRHCKSPRHMVRVEDATNNIISERYMVCFKCQPTMDSGETTDNSRRALSGDQGEMNYHAWDEESA